MATRRGLRQRVAFGIAILSILIVSAHSVAIYVITEDQEETQIDDVLAEEVESLLARYRTDPNTPPLRSNRLSSYIARDATERANVPAQLRDLPLGMQDIVVDGREYHVVVRALGNSRVYMTYDAQPHEERLREFMWLLIFGVVVTALAAAGLGYFIAGLLTRSVSDLAGRVSRFDPVVADQPIAARYDDEEVYRLAQAFDEYSARMAQFVAREQEFTANVSHELRTPLTTVRTSCELLLVDPQMTGEARVRVGRIERAAEQMLQLIQSLLLLARAHKPADVEAIDLHQCVAAVVDALRDTSSQQNVEFNNRVPASFIVQTDRGALEVVLGNILSNAVGNTRNGSVSVLVQEGALAIEDTGRGITAQDLPHIFDRFYRGNVSENRSGYGVGLAIVKHICDQHNWSIKVHSQPGRGTRVLLGLPSPIELDQKSTLS